MFCGFQFIYGIVYLHRLHVKFVRSFSCHSRDLSKKESRRRKKKAFEINELYLALTMCLKTWKVQLIQLLLASASPLHFMGFRNLVEAINGIPLISSNNNISESI